MVKPIVSTGVVLGLVVLSGCAVRMRQADNTSYVGPASVVEAPVTYATSARNSAQSNVPTTPQIGPPLVTIPQPAASLVPTEKATAASMTPPAEVPATVTENPVAANPVVALPASMPAPVVTAAPPAPSPAPAAWSYSGETGPAKWADLSPEFAQCRAGKNQSPVDLKWNAPKATHKIEFHYAPTAIQLVDDGRTISAQFASGSWAEIEGQRFELVQLMFHEQSEHTLSGKRFAMEAEFVHKNAEQKFAVVSVLFEPGSENPSIANIWSHLPVAKLAEPTATAQPLQLDPTDLLPKVATHYHYFGSLTAPPCTEGVNWNVLNTPQTLSPEQLAAFKKIYSNNGRPLQPLFGRKPANF